MLITVVEERSDPFFLSCQSHGPNDTCHPPGVRARSSSSELPPEMLLKEILTALVPVDGVGSCGAEWNSTPAPPW